MSITDHKARHSPHRGNPRPAFHKIRMEGIPKRQQLSHLFSDEQEAVNYLIANGVLEVPDFCHHCGAGVHYRPNKKNRVRCNSASCIQSRGGRWSQSIMHGSFLQGSRIKPNVLLEFLYMFVVGTTHGALMAHFGWSSKTATDWLKFAQELIGRMVLEDVDNHKIGGYGVVVQLDESKFGKRKYHRGHRVEGVWVFGGVEKTPERKCFLVPVEQRDRPTLHHWIKTFVRPGSIVVTDDWNAYKTMTELEGYDYIHEIVVHENEYVREDGANTNTIEGTWAGVKRGIPVRKRTESAIRGCLTEFMWRRKHKGRLWAAMVEALAAVRYE